MTSTAICSNVSKKGLTFSRQKVVINCHNDDLMMMTLLVMIIMELLKTVKTKNISIVGQHFRYFPRDDLKKAN